MLMLVSMTLILMQGHSDSVEENIRFEEDEINVPMALR